MPERVPRILGHPRPTSDLDGYTIKKQVYQLVRLRTVGPIPLSGLSYQLVDLDTKPDHLLGATGRYPAGEDRGAHFGMELYGEIPAKDEGLR